MNKKILILGGWHTLSSYIAICFAKNHYQPVLVSPYYNFHYPSSDFIQIHHNFDDTLFFGQLFQQHIFDGIIYAPLYDLLSYTNPHECYQKVNALITFLNQIEKTPIKKFIFIGNLQVYGNYNGAIDYTISRTPLTSAAKTQTIIEDIITDYCSHYDIKSLILRFSSIPSEAKKQENLNELMMAFQAFKKNLPMTILCTDHQTPDNSIIRDYLHPLDAAYAIVKGYEYLTMHELSDEFNIGSSSGISTKQIVEIMQNLFQKEPVIQYQPKKVHEPARQIVQIEKAQDLLHWQPHFSQINMLINSLYKSLK